MIPEKRSSFHSLLKQGLDNTHQWFAKNTFSPYWLKGQWRHPFASYSIAVLLELCALLLTFLLARLFPSFVFPGALTFITVTFIALSWGAGPGLIAPVLGALLINYIVIAPYFVWDIDGWDDVIELLLFIGVGLGLGLHICRTIIKAQGGQVGVESHEPPAKAEELAVRRVLLQ